MNEYNAIMEAMETGSGGRTTLAGKTYRPNPRVAMALRVQATTGLRVGDVLALRLDSFVKENGRYRFNGVIEQKTKKVRNFPVPIEVVDDLREYAKKHGIADNEPLFDLNTRAVQKYLLVITDDLGIKDISTHSFRKLFASEIYRKSAHNIELVRRLLQHSSAQTTQRYLGITDDELEQALLNHNLM